MSDQITLTNKLRTLKTQVEILEQINKIYSDVIIVNYRNRDCYCSNIVNSEAVDVEFLEPGDYFQGTYSICVYKELNISSNYQSKIRVYGFPIEILIFDLSFNHLSFYPFEKNFQTLKISPAVKNKVNSYILNFITKSKVQINPYMLPSKVKSLLSFI
jgi:hypothetical protein